MSGRSYHRRCEERLDRLRRRVEFLTARIASRPTVACVHDAQERSALLWAIEEIERWDVVAEILSSAESEGEKLARLTTLLRSRLRPSPADLARTPALARQYQVSGPMTSPEDL